MADSGRQSSRDERSETAGDLPVASVAVVLAERLADGHLIFVARDEQRATAIAAILAALSPAATVVHVPSSDALPGEAAPASPANAGRRVAALRRLRVALGDHHMRVALVTTAEATAVPYPQPSVFDAAPPCIRVGEALDGATLAVMAEEIGYLVDDRVDEPGEIAVRGMMIDIFPADRAEPVRIELAEGRVSAIRSYDPASQRSLEDLDAIEIGRAAEPPVEGGVPITDHLPAAAIALDRGADRRRDQFLAIAMDGGQRRRHAGRLVDAGAWETAIGARARVAFGEFDAPPRFIEKRNPGDAFLRFARKAIEQGTLLVVGSSRDLRYIAGRLARAKLAAQPIESWQAARDARRGSLLTLVAPIDRGVIAQGVTVVAGGDLLGGRARADELAPASADPMFADAAELRIGDLVVHEEFGIGTVEGLEPLPGELGGEAIALGYAKGGRRLVSVEEADRVWRYGADADAVSLDTLDGSSWQKRRGRIDAAVAESARGLAALAAAREAIEVEPIDPDEAAYERFAAGFPFTETPDQARAIAATRHDLAGGKAMDRLVVGDVGYGKTEVALRAAALVALAGRQVAIAAPTTVLVRQHLETFTRRFEGTGVGVAGLSRLSGAAERKKIRAGLADGSIRIVIGTGAIAGRGAAYHDLALVVIDEEQRFGTADKTKLRGLGAGHVMTLSATPIPRTLQTALVGLQQLSVIATPPASRQPIRTSLAEWNDVLVRTALNREKLRGGQSFVVVPRIEDMPPLAAKLARLVPQLEVVEAHGKLPPDALDAAMVGFAGGTGDVLLATNIIEAGLDVPRANTMIVHHADRFGLSQLHQLRGRVGRGARRGQILLLTEEGSQIAERTLKRLRTLQAFDRLGAGFAISARDLDMRGAGDLIGEAQAGHMKLIGVDLYQHLLGHALRAARGEALDRWTPELNLGLVGMLPPAWIPETDVRLTLYARLTRIATMAALDAFEEELEDRFGKLPEEARALTTLARLRVVARAANIARVDAGPGAIALAPQGNAALPEGMELEEKGGRWLLAERIEDPIARAERVETLLTEIAG